MSFFTDIYTYSFLQLALMAIVLSSIASGIVGTIVVVRRSTYIAGAISHCVLGGLGVARYFEVVHGMHWATPLVGAIASSVIAATAIAVSLFWARERLDSVLSIIWAMGMAIGISFIMKTPGYTQDLMGYLFGNILLVNTWDIVVMGLIDLVILVCCLVFYPSIVAVMFHEESARIKNIPVKAFQLIQLLLISLTVVVLSRLVGIVLVIALLSIPAAAASKFTRHIGSMMIVATVFSFIASIGGLMLSYQPQLPVGATIIQLTGVIYLLSVFAARLLKRFH